MVQQEYIKGLTKAQVETVSLQETMAEIKEQHREEYTRINFTLLLVFHMLLISDKLFADIEDTLETLSQFRYTIKRTHKRIAKDIHDSYIPLFRKISANTEDLGLMYEDNVDLEKMLKTWGGLGEPGQKVVLQDIPTEGEAVKASMNPVGDIFLRNGDGWMIHIPKAYEKSINVESSIMDSLKEGKTVPCGVQIYIGKEITND